MMPYEVVEDLIKGKKVIATKPYKKGELVCIGMPTKIAMQRDKYSLQKEEKVHVYLNEPAQLFNHSCEWNLFIRDNHFYGYDFYAYKDIEIYEELTFHYGMSEAESIAVPKCACQSPHCLGKSVGFKQLPRNWQECLYHAGVAKYLQVWYENLVMPLPASHRSRRVGR